MEAADAITEYRKVAGKKDATEGMAAGTIASAPGSRTEQFAKVLVAQGKAKAAAEAAKEKTEKMMEDVKVADDMPTKEPPAVPDDLESQASDLATKMGSGSL